MKSKQEIQVQVDGLLASKASLPQFSAFGDDNWKMIDSQLSILTGITTLDDYDEGEENEMIYSALMDTYYWLNGSGQEDLF